MGFRKSVKAALVLALLSTANASGLIKRTGPAKQPSCVNFTPFVYAGCFKDGTSPRTLLYASDLDSKTMTVEKCVAFCKGNDYKYAGLEYYGECYCGASVNSIQIEESNCNFPCNGNKTESCGGGDIISIYQDPTFPVVSTTTISDYMLMGCYTEGSNGRALGWRQDQVSTSTLTVENCLSACLEGGYAFAGVEYGSECYCGVVLGNGTLLANPAECDMRCAGDKTQVCGGPSRLNLYVAKILESIEPCEEDGPNPSSSSTTFPSPTISSVSTPSSLHTSTLVTTTTSVSLTSIILSSFSSSTPSMTSHGPSTTATPLSTTSVQKTSTTSPSTPSSPVSSTVLPTSFTTPSTTPSPSPSTVLSTPFSTLSSTPQPSSNSNSLHQGSTSSSTPSFTSGTTPYNFSTKSQSSTHPSSSTVSPTTTITANPSPTSTSSLVSISSTPSVTFLSTRSTFLSSTAKTSVPCTSSYTLYPPLPSPTCGYKVGKWCANPIPEFNDTFTCLKAFSSCVNQLSTCFQKAGFPESLKCNDFNAYCSRIAKFCGDYCPGSSCTLVRYKESILPYEVQSSSYQIPGTTYVKLSACPTASGQLQSLISATLFTTTTSTLTLPTIPRPTSLSTAPVPIYTNICAQPNNPNNGYGISNPVGGISLPTLSCNNEWSDFNAGYPFKLFTSSDTYQCPSYERTGSDGPSQGCRDACDEQFKLCNSGYADAYKGSKRAKRRGSEDYSSACKRCANQRDDCYSTNRAVSGGNRCIIFNLGY